jgi:spore coat polysaccharide biosynthesis protein SpsF (cytidylyltransferase family)
MEQAGLKKKDLKVGIFIGVRMKSTRLPKKALLEMSGRTAIEHLIDRLKYSKLKDIIVLCTSTLPEDSILVDIARQNKIEYFRGSPEDKLDRYMNAALKYGVNFIIITEGDNIFYEPDIIDEIVRIYQRTGADYVACKGLPLGTAPHGLKLEALQKVVQMKAENDTEVWGPYFTDTGIFHVEHLEVPDSLKRPDLRMTLDYPEDYEFFKEVLKNLYQPGKLLHLRDIIAFLDKNPQVVAINKNAQESYLHHIKKSPPIKLKG